MYNVTRDYLINVYDVSAGFNSLITQERAYSYEEAINSANSLALLYPQSQISIEEWKLIASDEYLVSGLYRGKTITLRANRKEDEAA